MSFLVCLVVLGGVGFYVKGLYVCVKGLYVCVKGLYFDKVLHGE